METTLAPLEEIVRIPSPAPSPQALAHDGEHLWMGSWETGQMYGIEPHRGTVFETMPGIGKPIGATTVGDELRVVCSEDGDSRFIRRYVPGHGFKSHDAVACPDDAGSFLAFDGDSLWLSQRHNKRVLRLDERHRVTRTVEVGEEIVGIALVGDRLYLSTWLGKERGKCRLAYVDLSQAQPQLTFLAQSPFVAISLAADGERLWTNDNRANELVAFKIPA